MKRQVGQMARLPIPWGSHLDLARCIEGIGKHDLAMATRTMAGAMHLLQRDLLIACVREELVQNKKACAFLH